MTDHDLGVLVIVDDRELTRRLRLALDGEDYRVACTGHGVDALQRLTIEHFDVVILAVDLPRLDGIHVCRRLRERGDLTPVLMLGPDHAVQDRLLGFHAGADDFLVKPFAMAELLARLRALLRRSAAPNRLRLECGDLVLDLRTHTVRRGKRILDLTATEQRLLEALMRHRGRVMSREALYRCVWGADVSMTSNVLDVYVGYVRRKTEAGGAPRVIQTVWGRGYRLGPASTPRAR